MGENERGEIYDDFHVIFRDAAQIERFIRNSKEKPRTELKSSGKSFISQDAEARKKAFVAAKGDIEGLKKEVLNEGISIKAKEESFNINDKSMVYNNIV